MSTEMEIDEKEETRRGEMLADILSLCVSGRDSSRYHTKWGTKTALGLYRTVRRIVDEGA